MSRAEGVEKKKSTPRVFHFDSRSTTHVSFSEWRSRCARARNAVCTTLLLLFFFSSSLFFVVPQFYLAPSISAVFTFNFTRRRLVYIASLRRFYVRENVTGMASQFQFGSLHTLVGRLYIGYTEASSPINSCNDVVVRFDFVVCRRHFCDCGLCLVCIRL